MSLVSRISDGFTQVAASFKAHRDSTTSVHGIPNTANLGGEMLLKYRAGIRSVPGWWASTGLVPTNVAQSAGNMFLMAILLAEDVAIDAVGINVATAVAGSTHRGLIYSTGTDNKPDAKLLDVEFVTTTVGLKNVAIPRLVLPRGMLWIGGLSLGGAPSITVVSGNHFFPLSPTQMYAGHAGALSAGANAMVAAPDPAPAMLYTANASRLQLRMVA